MFCDACGVGFEDGELSLTSKFCPSCGEELPRWMVAMQTSRSKNNPGAVTTNVDVDEELLYEAPAMSAPEITSPETLQSAHSPKTPPPPVPSPSPSISSLSEYAPSIHIPEISLREYDEISLNIADYDLPPSFPVPARFNTPFPRRKVITKVLGGNTQKTYPGSKDRRHPMYACPRMDYNPTVPAHQGHHGILITKPVPHELNPDNFILFVKHLTESLWYYRGQYRIRHASYLTPAQWKQQSRKFRNERTQWVVTNKDWGHRELRRLGLDVTFENARKAIERGDIKWEIG